MGTEKTTPRPRGQELPRVLIVDDDPDFIEATSAVLHASGFDVITSTDGEKGLELARSQRPDLIMLDIMMSYLLEGLSLGARLQADPELSRTPILMVSAIAHTEHLDKFPTDEPLPGQFFLTKPVPTAQLVQTVRWMLAGAGPARPAGVQREG